MFNPDPSQLSFKFLKKTFSLPKLSQDMSKVMQHLEKGNQFLSIHEICRPQENTWWIWRPYEETISIWAPSYTPHIPKIARNSNSLPPETTLSKILCQPQNLEFKISVVFHSNCYKWQITSGWTSYQKISYFRGNVVKNHTLRGKNRGSTLQDRRHSIPRHWIIWKLDNITTQLK